MQRNIQLINFHVVLAVALLLWAISFQVHGQERLCPDGKRSYFGVCPDESNNSRPPDIKPPQKFPPCPGNQWFREWHMCHVREDLGGGLVIDADFVNGAVYDPSMPAVQLSDYTLIDKIEGKFDAGTLSLGGAILFINFSELIKNGNVRKFKLVINSTKKALYALNERIGFGSVELPLNVQCTSRAFAIDGKVVAFLGTLGYGYPLNPLVLPIKTSDANKILQEGLVGLKEMSTETGGSMLQIEGVISKVLDSVCRS